MIEWLDKTAAMLGMNPWTVQVFGIILAALLVDFIYRKLVNRLQRIADRSRHYWDDALVYAGKRPISLLIYGQGLLMAARVLEPHTGAVIFSPDVLGAGQQLLLVITVTWLAFRMVTGFEQAYIQQRQLNNVGYDITTISVLARIVRIAVVVTGVLTALSILEIPISGLLAAGGVGGIAVGLAARDLLANFFGGFMVFMDRPFSVGDWVRSPDRDIEGVVARMGWRVTTIIKFDRRPMYVPNATFSTITVENPSRMTHRRIFEHVGVRYDDFSRVRPIVADIRDMLKGHEAIADQETLIVHFDRFGAFSLDIMVYCFTHTVQWIQYHEVREDVLLKIGDIIEGHGAEIAYPTRTLKIDRPPDAEPPAEPPAEQQAPAEQERQ
ncbi:MAG: mechanosensitive ion channel family protein [Wenzhouxiangellaceae bacterium]|nr:mechanosensitive ion channel family protein [Wenzhouxiangellaceae bacterium]